jgi:hypothetical protein
MTMINQITRCFLLNGWLRILETAENNTASQITKAATQTWVVSLFI